MSLKKKLLIAGITLIALAPAVANADDSLIQTKVATYDYRLGVGPTFHYTTDNPEGEKGVSNFLTQNNCLAMAADNAKKEIQSVESSAAYQNAFTAYRSECAGNSAPDPKFVLSINLATGIVNKTRQPTMGASVSVRIIDGNKYQDLAISKSNARQLGITYAESMNDTSCSNVNSLGSDLNLGTVSNQFIATLNARANACKGRQGGASAASDLLSQGGSQAPSPQNAAASDLLGQPATATQSSQNNSASDSISQGTWGPTGNAGALN